MVDFTALRKELVKKGIDFDRLGDGKGLYIEEPIKPLLYVLNLTGYATTASCGGHPLEEHRARVRRGLWAPYATVHEEPFGFTVEYDFSARPAPYAGPDRAWQTFNEAPWVDVHADPQKIHHIETLMASYAAQNNVTWRLSPMESAHRLQPVPKHSLTVLQDDIKRFASYLWESR